MCRESVSRYSQHTKPHSFQPIATPFQKRSVPKSQGQARVLSRMKGEQEMKVCIVKGYLGVYTTFSEVCDKGWPE